MLHGTWVCRDIADGAPIKAMLIANMMLNTGSGGTSAQNQMLATEESAQVFITKSTPGISNQRHTDGVWQKWTICTVSKDIRFWAEIQIRKGSNIVELLFPSAPCGILTNIYCSQHGPINRGS